MSHSEIPSRPILTPSILPKANKVIFSDASFFSSNPPSLPTPANVRENTKLEPTSHRSKFAFFPGLNLCVKYGPKVTIAEGQCLWAVRYLCPDVPVPEIYAWCEDQGETFLYMQFIQGKTLQDEWNELENEERYFVCAQLRKIFDDLRSLRQDPNDPFIGSSVAVLGITLMRPGAISRQPPQDRSFASNPPKGIFTTVPEFHTWFSGVDPMPECPWRLGLLDDAPIAFTHADLSRSNIMISWENETPQVVGILDWHQAGWYPAPWEFYKTGWTVDTRAWEMGLVLEFLETFRGAVCWKVFMDKLSD